MFHHSINHLNEFAAQVRVSHFIKSIQQQGALTPFQSSLKDLRGLACVQVLHGLDEFTVRCANRYFGGPAIHFLCDCCKP